MKKKSAFRHWVQNIWFDYCEECRDWKENPESLKLYWDKYKWWLKREFKHQYSDK